MSTAPKQSASSEIARWRPVPAWIEEIGWLVGRSLFPIVALLLIWGTVIWGPWWTLVLTVVWWRIVTRIG